MTTEAERMGVSEETERTIERTIEFAAPLERVWRAITDPAELASWFGDHADVELRVGYEGAFSWNQHGRFAMRVDVVEPPSLLVWSWVHEADVAYGDAPATRVEWRLTGRADGGTTLHLRETGFRTDLHHQQNTEGWDSELGELVNYVAG